MLTQSRLLASSSEFNVKKIKRDIGQQTMLEATASGLVTVPSCHPWPRFDERTGSAESQSSGISERTALGPHDFAAERGRAGAGLREGSGRS